eukprot:g940.t1
MLEEAAADPRCMGYMVRPHALQGDLKAMLQRLETIEDLDVPATEEERGKLPLLRDKSLEILGKKAAGPDGVPADAGWMRCFYLRGALLRFLRGRAGDVDKAAVMHSNAMRHFEESDLPGRLAKFEDPAYKPAEKALFKRLWAAGFYGVDVDGAAVIHVKHTRIDWGGLLKATGPEFTIEREWYDRFVFWDCLYQESKARRRRGDGGGDSGGGDGGDAAAPQWIPGRVMISDVDGLSWSRFLRARAYLQLLSPVMKDRWPEGVRAIFLINTSWLVLTAWGWVKRFIPKATVEKVRIYKKGQDARFLADVQEFVALEQLPVHLGGKNEEAWPYGEGGDVRNDEGGGAAAAAAAAGGGGGGGGGGGDGAGGDRDHSAAVALHVSKSEVACIPVAPGTSVVWEWRLLAHDMDYSVVVVADADADPAGSAAATGPATEIEPKRRAAASEGWITGSYSAPADAEAPAVVELHFDNSFSWARSKDVEWEWHVLDGVVEDDPSIANAGAGAGAGAGADVDDSSGVKAESKG